MIARHRPMMIVFSIITIAYHMFFIGMLTMRLGDGAATINLVPAIALAAVVFLAGLAVSAIPLRVWPWVAVLVYGVSLTTLGMIGVEPLALLSWSGAQPLLDVIWLGPAIVFGFLLCPYLDLTFHRAVQETPSRHSFGVFGVTFTVMLVLTAAYHTLGNESINTMFGEGAIAGRFLVAHLLAQTIFTIGVHCRELRVQQKFGLMLRRCGVLMLPMLGVLPVVGGALLHWSYAVNEAMYLRWLVFYGLIFPAYVLVFIGPWRAKRLTATNLGQLTVALIAFVPLYELGFIHHWTAAVLPPMLLLILAVVVTPGTADTTPK